MTDEIAEVGLKDYRHATFAGHEDRFWRSVEKTGDCWHWLGTKNRLGYGQFSMKGKSYAAHRVAYESLAGPIPSGLVIDHLCRNPKCVNPAHLEPVTNRENIIRGVSAQRSKERGLAVTHCKRGHEYTPENTIVCRSGRACRICMRASQAASERKRWQHKTHLSNGPTSYCRAETRSAGTVALSANVEEVNCALCLSGVRKPSFKGVTTHEA